MKKKNRIKVILFKFLTSIINSSFALKRINILIRKIRFYSQFAKPKGVKEGFDREYIEDYIKSCRKYVKEQSLILEFDGEVKYAKKLDLKNSKVFLATSLEEKIQNTRADLFFDLTNDQTIPEAKFDCIIATQVICYMTNGVQALENLKSMLNEGGILMLTNSGPIYMDNGDGYKTFYTLEGLKEICEKVFGNMNVFNIRKYGTLETGIYALTGVRSEKKRKMQQTDDGYSVIIGMCCKK